MMKQCQACGEEKDSSCFGPRSRSLDGLAYRCRSCEAIRIKARRVADPARQKEVADACYAKWRSEHPGQPMPWWKDANARYQKAHPDAVAESKKRYREKHPGFNDRRIVTLRAMPPWLSDEHRALIDEKYAEAKRLTIETGIEYHVDHEIPLKGKTVRGLHVPWNLRVIPASVNMSKGNRIEGATP